MNFNALIIGVAITGGLLVAMARLSSGFTDKPGTYFNLTMGSWGLILIALSVLITIIEGLTQ